MEQVFYLVDRDNMNNTEMVMEIVLIVAMVRNMPSRVATHCSSSQVQSQGMG